MSKVWIVEACMAVPGTPGSLRINCGVFDSAEKAWARAHDVRECPERWASIPAQYFVEAYVQEFDVE